MIDINLLRNDFETTKKRLETRGGDFSYLSELQELDTQNRNMKFEVGKLKNEKNELSKEIGELKRQKKDASGLLSKVEELNKKINEYDKEITQNSEKIKHLLLITPNVPRETLPIGKDENDNREVKRWGEIPKFSFPIKEHWELGEALDILDFDRAGKLSGSRFVVYKGLGARLERALIAFMMDVHANQHGYKEVIAPYMVKRECMEGTGQLPKFEEDSYKMVDTDLFLVPTSEVSSINLHRNEVLNVEGLPLKYVSFSPCFRKEAGSAGRDTKGIIRQHQFHKVELIKFTKPEESYIELEKMVEDVAKILELLEIPYRIVELCTGDLGFSMAQTYDLEVWLPSQNMYREVSSVSNAEDYQARRANIKFRRTTDSKLEYVHTLNGSGVATPRLFAAILENYQQPDGSIKVPKVLIPYMAGIEYIK
jgi:seryl-tRNA synthetase